MNLGTGSVFVSVPLLTLPGRNGLNYSVSLVSSSQAWNLAGNSTASIGMYLTRTGAVTFKPSGSIVLSNNPDIRCIGGYAFTDENGGAHTFSQPIQTGCWSMSSCQNPGGCVAQPSYNNLGGTDERGEGISVDLIACKLTLKTGVWFPLTGCSTVNTMGGAAYLPYTVTMENPNGNAITSFGAGSNGTDMDSLGRKITFSTSGATTTIQYYDSNYNSQTIKVTYGTQSQSGTCSYHTSQQGNVNSPVNVIGNASAVLPNGLSYIFQYDQCGTLNKVVYPSGGYTRYQFDYSNYTHILTPPTSNPRVTGTDVELVQKYVCRQAPASLFLACIIRKA